MGVRNPPLARRLAANWLWMLVVSMVVMFTWWTARFTLANSYFIADDYDHFQLAGALPFEEFLLTPIDVHFVPLHRLFSYLLLKLAPLNFSLAVWLLIAFQLASLLMLYRVLEKIRKGPWNPPLVLLCACNSALLHLIIWWSAGIHRLPYVLLTLVSLFFYLRYRERQRPIELIGCFLSAMIALGFYSKAVLIPFYVLALEFCLSWREALKAWRRYVPGAVLLLLSLAYVGWYLKFAPVQRSDVSTSPDVALEITVAFFRVLMNLVLLRELSQWGLVEALVVLFWSALILVTCLRKRENVIYWLALLGVLALNFLLIAGSSRGQLLGAFLAGALRYYYEVFFLAAIFLCLILNPVPNESRGAAQRVQSKTWSAAVLMFCLIYPLAAYHAAKEAFAHTTGPVHKQASRYMRTLLASLDALPAGSVQVAEGDLPLYVYGDWLKIAKPYSQILPLRYPNMRFVPHEQAQYEIDPQGQVSALAPH